MSAGLKLVAAAALAFTPVSAGVASQGTDPTFKGKCVSNPPVDSMMKGRVPVADVTVPKCDTLVVRAGVPTLSFYRGDKPVYSFSGHFDEPSTMIVDEVTIGDAPPIKVDGGSCATYGKLPGPALTSCTADWQSNSGRVGVAVLFEMKKRVSPKP